MSRVEVDADEHGVRFFTENGELGRYVADDTSAAVESPHPYFHPLFTTSHELVTVFRPHDHVWHKGLGFVVAYVDDANFWGGPSYNPITGGYDWLDNNGHMSTASFDAFTDATGIARVQHDLDWVPAHERKPVVHDARRYAVRAAEDHWSLDVDISLENVTTRALAFGSPATHGREGAGYGGLFWRGPRSFTGGRIAIGSSDGVVTRGDDDLMGVHGRWAAYLGDHDGTTATSTVLIINRNRDTQPWFVRSAQFGALCAAPFFETEMLLPPGTTADFAWTVVVAAGDSDDVRLLALAREVTK